MVATISRLIQRKFNHTVYLFRSISLSSSAQRTTGKFRYSNILNLDLLFCPIFGRYFTDSLWSSSKRLVSKEECDLEESDRGVNRKFGLDRRRRNVNDLVNVNEEKEKKVVQIVELIKRDESELESKMMAMDVIISIDLIREVFGRLNYDVVSGLHFFCWLSETHIDFKRSSVFCSMIIDNLGRVEDYDSMVLLFKDFSRKGICLSENAFAFLADSLEDAFNDRDNVRKIVELLIEAGGSAGSSGIFYLIKMLCILKAFDLAVFVMEETARRTSYYNVLVWAKCRGSEFQEARELFGEMKRFGCYPNSNTYNYLLGSLCKYGRIGEACNLVEVMNELGYMPDAITFEIFIFHACRLDRLDFAIEFLNQMISGGLEPRLTTHAAFIKGYFNSNRFQEAYKFVVDMAVKYKYSANVNYSLLASLHYKKGKLFDARDILVFMIEKGLKPNFPVYVKVSKDLYKAGMSHLAADLKSRFSKLNSG
ncbi:hypothetical protein MKX01_038264 [Papaver californicum]|nr:hypothetical protein MKX01_038264 [Papaver californicum]